MIIERCNACKRKIDPSEYVLVLSSGTTYHEYDCLLGVPLSYSYEDISSIAKDCKQTDLYVDRAYRHELECIALDRGISHE